MDSDVRACARGPLETCPTKRRKSQAHLKTCETGPVRESRPHSGRPARGAQRFGQSKPHPQPATGSAPLTQPALHTAKTQSRWLPDIRGSQKIQCYKALSPGAEEAVGPQQSDRKCSWDATPPFLEGQCQHRWASLPLFLDRACSHHLGREDQESFPIPHRYGSPELQDRHPCPIMQKAVWRGKQS